MLLDFYPLAAPLYPAGQAQRRPGVPAVRRRVAGGVTATGTPPGATMPAPVLVARRTSLKPPPRPQRLAAVPPVAVAAAFRPARPAPPRPKARPGITVRPLAVVTIAPGYTLTLRPALRRPVARRTRTAGPTNPVPYVPAAPFVWSPVDSSFYLEGF